MKVVANKSVKSANDKSFGKKPVSEVIPFPPAIERLENRIFNEDCMAGMKRIPARSIPLVLTDIPYGEVNEKNRGVKNGLRNLDKGKADITTFELESFLGELVRVSNGFIYVWCGFNQISTINCYLKERGFTTRIGVWEKTNPAPFNGQYTWLSAEEFCVIGRAKGQKAVFNKHCVSPVWRFPSGRSKFHPTEKPLALFKHLVEASSNPGDLVLDTCLGSGTTAVAAKQLARKYIGFELDRGFYDYAVSRVKLAKEGAETETKPVDKKPAKAVRKPIAKKPVAKRASLKKPTAGRRARKAA